MGLEPTTGVLCCFALFVCLTLLASFFLPSHLSFKNMYVYIELELAVFFFPTQFMPLVQVKSRVFPGVVKLEMGEGESTKKGILMVVKVIQLFASSASPDPHPRSLKRLLSKMSK